jgi:hypothetical protein
MTACLLANGTNKAPAAQAPAHGAGWLVARGYRIVRSPGPASAGPGDLDLVARIDWRAAGDEDGRPEIVREVLASSAVPTDIRRVA